MRSDDVGSLVARSHAVALTPRRVHGAQPAREAHGEQGAPLVRAYKRRTPLKRDTQVDLVGALADVARALVRLHSTGHIHRDVKARNVLVRTCRVVCSTAALKPHG